MSDEDIQTHTEPTSLEFGMEITIKADYVKIEVGGGQQPRWAVVGDSLEDAIGMLVREVTSDAIKDEAREWKEHGAP